LQLNCAFVLLPCKPQNDLIDASDQPKESRLKTWDLRAKSEKQMFGNDTVPLIVRRSLRKEGYTGNSESGLVRFMCFRLNS